ncbi:hypothetical protein JHW45_13015 [Paracoccus stylophorae]|uniref:DUF2846 domain-containing protein n=1 Tax=Paracoccus stylophorae TaxID=659350 RepID=A0ABY7SVL4_9RHOB|nr:hypothetical protein [Paracoccus stylophorae]WCR09982.1 hypothetical protein JHW45_13015 [Paracoccus stylophorae]
MMRPWLTAILLCLILPAAALAQSRPPAGLMWNRTGLPATFPLHVRTPQGQDHVMFLIDPDTDRQAMAAFIHGGQLLRVLVPPGDYLLRFAHGRDWQGEDRLFGDATQTVETARPLTFALRGRGRRGGHLVTLAQRDGRMQVVQTRPLDWCQIPTWHNDLDDLRDRFGPRDFDRLPEVEPPRDIPTPQDERWGFSLRERPCD